MKTLFLPLALILAFSASAEARNALQYRELIDLSDQKGQSFLNLMKETIKPALDAKAKEGFFVVDGKRVAEQIRKVEKKVADRAIKSAGSLEKLKSVADQLNRKNEKIAFQNLPEALKKIGGVRDVYDLTTFLSLVSEGGVAVKIDANNISYNVNYGTGERPDDERTGRSFGESNNRLALDASDKHYLSILEEYVRSDKQNIREFYRVILNILFNSDPTGFNKITPAGQAVASDFLAVYIAEQNRHLMSNLRNHPWDEALLEVTLLAALHSGQEKVMVMYEGQLTDKTKSQATGCAGRPGREKPASMIDYWQFSNSSDPAHCSRSGINITRKDFRALGKQITSFQRAANPELVSRIERAMRVSRSENLFASLSGFLISNRAPARYDRATLKLAEDFAEFLVNVQASADANSNEIIGIRR